MDDNAHLIAKEYLSQVRDWDEDIDCNLEELSRLKARRLKITATWSDDPVSSSHNNDILANITIKIIAMEQALDDEIDAFINLKQKAKAIVSQVKNPDQRKILKRHYFLHETLEQIACEMPMAYRHVTRTHKRALQEVYKIMKKEKVVL